MAEKRAGRTADEMAEKQRDISVSEFFNRNRHLLGFDNPIKALMTTVKEGVDNALDACEEAGILPEVVVEITRVADLERGLVPSHAPAPVPASGASGASGAGGTDGTAPAAAAADSLFQRTLFDPEAGDDTAVPKDKKELRQLEKAERAAERAAARSPGGRKVTDPPEKFLVAIEDNGPGIVPEQIGKVFGKLLYGSKFHRLRQGRGQQGIGISAAGMYGQLTTGKPVKIISRTSPKKPAHTMEVALDVLRNQPDVRNSREMDWDRPQGTRVEIELEAKYQKGVRSVDTYLRATALANPHVTVRYRDPDGIWQVWTRAAHELPAEPREVQPHPYGVELGMLLQMMKVTQNRKLGAFLENDFCRVTRKSAAEICDLAGLTPETWVARVAREEAAKLHDALSKVKLIAPPTDCVSPIGEGLLVDSLQREYPNAFIRAVTRAPAVYRGYPFQVEVALAHDPSAMRSDEPVTLMRFANRVPLLYQQSACAIHRAVVAVPWRRYGISQSRGALPTGPMVLAVHVASVWVPFTSESKEAVASYDEILDELKLALKEAGRSLGTQISRAERHADELKRRDYIARYIPKISEALQKILEFDDGERDRTTEKLTDILNRSRNL